MRKHFGADTGADKAPCKRCKTCETGEEWQAKCGSQSAEIAALRSQLQAHQVGSSPNPTRSFWECFRK